LLFDAANGVYRRRDFHQRAQVAGHQIKSVVESDLQGGSTSDLFIVKLNLARLRLHFAIVHQEEKLRIPDAHAVAVLESSPFHRHVIDEGAVETIEVEYYKLLLFFVDLGMPARNGSIRDAKGGG